MANTTTKIENPTKGTKPSVSQINKNFAAVASAEAGSTLNWYDNGLFGGLYTTEVLAKAVGKTESVEDVETALVAMTEFILAGILGTTGDVTVALNEDRTKVVSTIGGLSKKTEEIFELAEGESYTFEMDTDLTAKFNVYAEGRKGSMQDVVNEETGETENKLVTKINGIVKQYYNELVAKISRPSTVVRKRGVSGVVGEDGQIDPKLNEHVATITRKLRTDASTTIWFEHTEIGKNATVTNKHFRAVNDWKPAGHTTTKTVSKKVDGKTEKTEVEVSDAGFVPQNLINGVLVSKSVEGFDTSVFETRTTDVAINGLTAATFEGIKKNSSVAIEDLTAAVTEEQSMKFAAYAHLVSIAVNEEEGNITVTFPTAFFRNGAPARLEKLYANLDTELSVIVLDVPTSDLYRTEKGSNTDNSVISRFQKNFREIYKSMKADYKTAEEAGEGVTLNIKPLTEEEAAKKKAAKAKRAANKAAKEAEKALAEAEAITGTDADADDEFAV